MSKRIKLYASDSVLEEFYSALASNDVKAFQRVHIPRSDVLDPDRERDYG